MTLIVGVDYGSELLMIADTRVSDKKGKVPPKDMLLKLVFIDYFQRQAALGFSGNIHATKKIIESITRKAKYYKSSGNLKDDIKKWTEEAIKMERQRHNLQFMLCDFDPNDKTHIYIFDVNEDGSVQIQPKNLVAVIGSGKKLESNILKTTLRGYGNPKAYKDYQAYSDVRTKMVASVISIEFMDIGSKDVGGPFVVANVRPNGCLGPRFLWPFDGTDSSNVQEADVNKKTILHNPSSGEEYTLYSIYQYDNADFYQVEGASASLISK